ncbi:hypothetical protein M9Y10_040861 [Tritrichomonas musculus]|uniref:Uncharacterized protein n=1 Tax=Tritrichomonas musculus TaxID=1915356 RepID=A0ABR2K2V3_9EUKA
MSSSGNSEQQGTNSRASKTEEPRAVKPLPSLLVDVTPDEHDTEVDLLLPYFTKRVKANKKNMKKHLQEQTESESKKPPESKK